MWGTGDLSYPNNAEPFSELEMGKIELIDEFFVELIPAAKFPYFSSTVPLGVHW